MAKVAFVGFGEVNTPIDIIIKKCSAAAEALEKEGLDLISVYPVTDDYEEKESDQAGKDNINRRLAEEFLELQSEFPQIDEFGALPQWVKECSAKDGVPLKYAYALHACRQQAKITAAEAHQQAAAKATAHSLKSAASDGTSPEMASVYKALWGQY